ncbi:MAG TPA: YitT family protein [Candidatus Blautia pullicola]|uniref:YitT family protein n=1 Tax=Candidatus Blautia pullicola TaxID=2838498 RepID=A0A9D2JTG9_9FIRM|nr:YitT family protein [Candidatus Blautia pullicola]
MNPKIDTKREARRLIFGLIGALIMAANIKTFVRAGGLYPGGFNGVTLLIQTVCQRFFGLELPFSPISLALNAIPAIISFKAIGKRFTLVTSLMIVVTSIFTDLVPAVPITQDILLISIFGGLINGAAISLALIGGTSTGGTDFIAVYFMEKRNKDVWNYILMGNAVVLVLAGILFGWDKALYSIIFQYTSTQTIHLLYQAYNKVTLFVVTEHPQEVYEAIYEVTNHSATEFSATGMYANEDRKMIYSVVSSTEAKILIQRVMTADPKAFVNVIKTDMLMGRFYQKENY